MNGVSVYVAVLCKVTRVLVLTHALVSFQENANRNYPSVAAAKEFSLMFRRGSVAPLASRIRAHRPPTAPPGSIFINRDNHETR